MTQPKNAKRETRNAQRRRRITLRAAQLWDAGMLREWIAADPEHRGKTCASFFCDPEPGAETLVFGDKAGEVLFAKLTPEPTLRIDIQFPPFAYAQDGAPAKDARRIARALAQGFAFVLQRARECGYRRVVFASANAKLRAFCFEHFGFEESEGDLVRVIQSSAITPRLVGTANGEHDASDGKVESQKSKVKSDEASGLELKAYSPVTTAIKDGEITCTVDGLRPWGGLQ